MRVVMLTPGLPQPTGGGAAIRNWYILRFLREELGATVSLLTFDRGRLPSGSLPLPPGVDVTVLPAPARDWRRRARVLATSGQADLADRLWSAEAQARLLLHALREPADILHVGGLELGRYALEVARHREPTGGPAIVLDDYNAEYTLQRRAFETDIRYAPRWPVAAYSAVQWWRLARFERAACAAADRVVCVSEEDAGALARLTGHEPPFVIPNGVDCERYSLPGAATEPLPRFDLVFSGTMDYRPNVDAALWLVRTVWPLLRERFPHLTLALVGQQPAPPVRRLADTPGVTVTGPVPDDRPFLWGAGLYAVPMRFGGGVRLKLLNALATGCPVVTTSMGAEGVAARHGLHLMVADRPDQWLRLVTRVMTEPALRDRLREGGRQLVLDQYQWRSLVKGFAEVYAMAREQRAAASVAANVGLGWVSRPTHDDQPAMVPVSVIATVLNEVATIDELLAALAAQTVLPSEIVFVDAGSTDGTTARLASWARRLPVRVIDAPGVSISAGRNMAIEAATHEVVAVTDAGTRPKPGWLGAITARLLAAPGPDFPAVVGGWFVGDPRTTFEVAMAATVLPDLSEIVPERFLPSSRSIAFHKAAWRVAGGYPEWLDYCEDLVFDLRLLEAGVAIAFAPAASVHFRPRSSLSTFWRQYWNYARGDGKAGLWRRRHIIRYASYGLPLIAMAGSPRLGTVMRALMGLALLSGGVGYRARPYARLLPALGRLPWPGRVAALALVPLIRVVGDLAKMGGYPVGLWWRARRYGLRRGWREIELPSTPPPLA